MKITMVMAITADGKIAKNAGQTSLEWTSAEDTKFFVQKTKEAGTLIMGKNTFETIGKPLPGRRIIVLVKPGSVPPPSIETHGEKAGKVEFTGETPAQIVKRLENEGVENAILAGGALINGLFLDAGLIDEIFLTIEPVFFGSGMGLFEGPGAAAFGVKNHLKMDLVKIHNLSDNVVNLHYKVRKL